MVGVNKRQRLFEWITQGDSELIVAIDAISLALKGQDMIVSEKR